MEKKVTIVTYYNALNYGAFLQAYALKKFIESQGDSAYFIKMDIKNRTIEDENEKNYEKTLQINLQKLQEQLPVVSNNENIKYDLAVIGSDEVFNFMNAAYQNFKYFDGTELNAKEIISYAASIGGGRYRKLILKKFTRFVNLRKLDAISVRDIRTERLIKWFYKGKIERCVDPTLLVDFDDEITVPQYENYALVYTYGMNQSQIKAITEYAKKNQYKLIGTGSYCEWCDVNYPVSAFEWLGLIKQSKIVITSTFHGTIFAIKYRKKFVSLVDHSEKVKSLLDDFELKERWCTTDNIDNFEKICEQDVNYNEQVISEKIENSKMYLKRFL